MSSKKCIYRDCSSTGTGEPTLFAFPKDDARRKIWLQMAGRPNHTLQKSDCLCELHFGRQYISSNQRRKVLVGLSVPHPYQQEQDNDDEQQIEALDECERLDISEMFGEDSQQPEDVRSYSSNSAIDQVVDFEPETIICDQTAATRDKLKRKIIEQSPQNAQNGTSLHPMKLMKLECNKTKPKNGVETTQRPQIKDTAKQKSLPTTIIDHPDVSTLYIRGEEFIQMPTSLYLEEKSKLENSHIETYTQEIMELRAALAKYQNVIEIIKNGVRTLP